MFVKGKKNCKYVLITGLNLTYNDNYIIGFLKITFSDTMRRETEERIILSLTKVKTVTIKPTMGSNIKPRKLFLGYMSTMLTNFVFQMSTRLTNVTKKESNLRRTLLENVFVVDRHETLVLIFYGR